MPELPCYKSGQVSLFDNKTPTSFPGFLGTRLTICYKCLWRVLMGMLESQLLVRFGDFFLT